LARLQQSNTSKGSRFRSPAQPQEPDVRPLLPWRPRSHPRGVPPAVVNPSPARRGLFGSVPPRAVSSFRRGYPLRSPACLPADTPRPRSHGPGLERGMLSPPRTQVRPPVPPPPSRISLLLIPARYPAEPARRGQREVSRGRRRMPSCPPTAVNTRRDPWAYPPASHERDAGMRSRLTRYPQNRDGCASLPRHHSQPKGLAPG
jgi:hypothetical protein